MTKSFRYIILFGPPILVGLVNLFHPVHASSTGIYNTISLQIDWWLTLHVINMIGFAAIGLSVYLLVKDLTGLPATICKLALAVYLPFYVGFDALIGIGTGTLVKYATTLSPADLVIVERAIDDFWNNGLAYALAAIGSLGWLIALMSASIALTEPARQRWVAGFTVMVFLVMFMMLGMNASFTIILTTIGIIGVIALFIYKPRLPGTMFLLSGLFMSVTHVAPNGPLSMLCLVIGIAALEFGLTTQQPVAEIEIATS
jgi:hypothetical protein